MFNRSEAEKKGRNCDLRLAGTFNTSTVKSMESFGTFVRAQDKCMSRRSQ